MMVTGGFYEEMIRNKSICKRVFNLYVSTCLVLNENQGAVTKTHVSIVSFYARLSAVYWLHRCSI